MQFHFRVPAVWATVGEKVATWWSSLLKIILAVEIELLVGSMFIQIILKAMLLKFSEAST